MTAAEGLFESCIAAIPYAPATAFLAGERAKLDGRSAAMTARRRGSRSSPTASARCTASPARSRRSASGGCPAIEIEVVGTDPEVDRRLPAVAEIDVPFYPGLRIGVPSLPAAVQTLDRRLFDAIHVCSPGPVGMAGVLLARALGLPLIGSYHTELTAYAELRSGRPQVAQAMAMAVGAFYSACDVVLSPSPASDLALTRDRDARRAGHALGPGRGHRALRPRAARPGPARAEETIDVLYSGRITREKGAELLGDAFVPARAAIPGCAWCWPAAVPSRSACASGSARALHFLGWLSGAPSSRGRTRARTSSCSRVGRTRSAR